MREWRVCTDSFRASAGHFYFARKGTLLLCRDRPQRQTCFRTYMTYPALIGATLIFGLTASAEDTSFKKTRLSSPTDLKSVPANLTITKSGISIHTKAGSAADVELPFSTVSRINYGTKDRRRLLEGAIIAPVLAATKAQSH